MGYVAEIIQIGVVSVELAELNLFQAGSARIISNYHTLHDILATWMAICS
jgi:hypothetical protein